MSYRLRSLLCLCLALWLASAARAADALDRAIAHAESLQTPALGAIEVTLRRQPVPPLAEDMGGIWYN